MLSKFKLVINSAREESKKTSRPFFEVLFDIIKSKKKYLASPLDYQLFGFGFIKDEKYRRSFLLAPAWRKISQQVIKDDSQNFNNKINTYKMFREYFRREVLIIEEVSKNKIIEFYKKHGTIFAKSKDGYGGLEVERFVYNPDTLEKDISEICSGKYHLLEEKIIQHKDMANLSPNAVSTLRVTMLKNEDEVHFLPTIIRISCGESYTDNISGGGTCIRVEKDGVIRKPAFTEPNAYKYSGKVSEPFYVHPQTGVNFINYEIPHYREALEYAKELMLKQTAYRYLGFDIAITQDSVDLVEINPSAGYDLYQYYYHMSPDNMVGARPEIEKFFGYKETFISK